MKNKRLMYGIGFLCVVGVFTTSCNRKVAPLPPAPLGSTSAPLAPAKPDSNTLHKDTLKAMQPIAKRPELILSYEREACYGKCPSYFLQVYDDGTILFDGKRYTKQLGKIQLKTSKTQIAQLTDHIRQAALWQMAPTYPTNGLRITDLPASYLTLRNATQEKKIANYYDAPTALVEFERYLDEWVHELLE
jgi:hypothetical protein